MKTILRPGVDLFQTNCSKCGAVFSYEKEDVYTDYIRGADVVSCPQCHHLHLHLGSERGLQGSSSI